MDREGVRHTAGASHWFEWQVEVRGPGRETGARQAAADRSGRRRAGQAGGDRTTHWPPAGHVLRQLRRRPSHAPIHHCRTGPAIRTDRPPHGRGAGVGVRPRVACRQARQGPGRGPEGRVGRNGHEKGVEGDLPVPEVTMSLDPAPTATRAHHDLSYRTRLVLGIGGLVLLTGAAITWLAHRSARQSTETLTDQIFSEASDNAVDETREIN